MRVRNFRSVEEMDAANRHDQEQGGADWRAISNVFGAADAGSPRKLKPGVCGRRTLEEWDAQTDLWEAEAVQRILERTTHAQNLESAMSPETRPSKPTPPHLNQGRPIHGGSLPPG